jgi:hypothetical protein
MNARQRTSEQWRAAKRRLGLDEETTRAQVLAMVRAGNWDGNKGKVLCRRTGRMVPKPKPFDPWAKWRRIELGDSPRPRVNGWRGKEAPTYSPSIDRARVTETEGWTEWKGSTPKNYNRATCTVHIVSAGRVLADGLHWRYQVPGGELRTGIMRAPRGWHWSADYLGAGTGKTITRRSRTFWPVRGRWSAPPRRRSSAESPPGAAAPSLMGGMRRCLTQRWYAARTVTPPATVPPAPRRSRVGHSAPMIGDTSPPANWPRLPPASLALTLPTACGPLSTPRSGVRPRSPGSASDDHGWLPME